MTWNIKYIVTNDKYKARDKIQHSLYFQLDVFYFSANFDYARVFEKIAFILKHVAKKYQLSSSKLYPEKNGLGISSGSLGASALSGLKPLVGT